jgi:hypothetical protein
MAMTTLLTDSGEIDAAEGEATGEQLWLSAERFQAATGWSLRPEGFCKGSLCVPVPPDRARQLARDGRIDAAALWRYLGKPVVHSADGDVWVLGEAASDRARVLQSLEAPDFTLPDPAGRLHALSDYRGKKVLLVTWASW